ncbi:MAG: MFS transporter [Acidobacteria bacterium]|nr:MFS transporter [Acidobacteriota bacterium]MBI3664290.1 MFS transporter [Acidobacteriota bacterium]
MGENEPTTPPAMHAPDGRGFWSLIVTQFQVAFSDNTLKTLISFLVLGSALPQAKRDFLVAAVAAIFSVTFILFSMTGGYLADRFSKRSVTIAVKVFEIGVMLVALVGLAFGHLGVGIAAVFLMGVHSALFGPSKYGLLPELLPQKRLSWGNGVLELTTFVAIIAGTVAAGLMAEAFAGRQVWSGGILIALAVLGWMTSLGIARVPAADPGKKLRVNFVADFFEKMREARQDRVLWLAILGNTYFWFLGALLVLNIFVYGKDVLGKGSQETSYLQAAVAIGIGLGSFVAGYLSANKIEHGLIPLGALGISAVCTVLGTQGFGLRMAAANLGVLGFFAGFFAVPVNALIQHRPSPDRKGGVIAASNLMSFVGIFLASGVFFVLKNLLRLSPIHIFLFSALLTLCATAYVLWLLPESLVRLVLLFMTKSVYRIRVEGRDNIPEKGGALFVSNHLSFVDAALLTASTDRFIRFMMFKGIYDHPAVWPFAKLMRAIPISSLLRPREMIKSLREASEAIQNGEVVCIFAEGQITRIGQMLPFRRGFERIMKDVDAPIVPVHLDGVWGSIFSFESRRFLWKIPRALPYPTTVSFGQPMPPTATAMDVRQAVQELASEAFRHKRQRLRTLHRAWLRNARWHPFRFAMADPRVPKLRFASALTKTIFLARRLKQEWRGQKMVGILLPPSVAGALVNFAALLSGKVPVNLNYTASDEVIAACARQCGLETVVTSKAFLERVKLQVPGRTILLEELADKPHASEKLAALAMSWTFPAGMLEKTLGREKKVALDDLATVIFSSGSTGEPKGVMLSHYNVMANVDQVTQALGFRHTDRVFGILPFFHSFGFTVTLWLPASLGASVVYYPNPLDAQAIGTLVREYEANYLLATPTFLQAYIRRVPPEDFGSLEYVIVGAEKLSPRTAEAFEERFGVRPLEGYGCTECAPVVAVNTRDFRAPGFRQVGAKRGRIGHPLPGVSVRIVDPDTMQPLPLGTPGLMLVRGPNVMQGYLNHPDKTADALRDGWYATGDIASMDEDGFLTITDRLSRFSKIGGEMVPHLKVEEKLHELAGATEQTFVVTGVPDGKKGERLVVLHTLPEEKLKGCQEKLAQSDLPNLWVPRANQFFRVEKLPYLGSGKLDLRRVRETAVKLSPES